MNKNKTEEVKKKNRFNETKVIKEYLKSENGIPFLIKSTKDSKMTKNDKNTQFLFKNANESNPDELYRRIDEVIDFFTIWTKNFPVRKNLKMSKYEFLKIVEDFCSKPEIATEMSSYISN